jgi:hypothetical protein
MRTALPWDEDTHRTGPAGSKIVTKEDYAFVLQCVNALKSIGNVTPAQFVKTALMAEEEYKKLNDWKNEAMQSMDKWNAIRDYVSAVEGIKLGDDIPAKVLEILKSINS